MRKSNEKTLFDKNTEHNRSATLFGLPTEILLKIFRYVPGSDAARAGQTCKASYAIAQMSPVKDEILREKISRSIRIIAGRYHHFLWRKFDSACTLFATGRNNWGQLGTGDERSRNTLTPIKLPSIFAWVHQIAVGDAHTLIYGTDAEGMPLLATSGSNKCGQLGIGNFQGKKSLNTFTLVRLPPAFKNVHQIAAGGDHSLVCGTDVNGHPLIAACGHSQRGQPWVADGVDNSIFNLVTLTKAFTHVNQIVTNALHSAVCGTNAEGRPLLAVSGANLWGGAWHG